MRLCVNSSFIHLFKTPCTVEERGCGVQKPEGSRPAVAATSERVAYNTMYSSLSVQFKCFSVRAQTGPISLSALFYLSC